MIKSPTITSFVDAIDAGSLSFRTLRGAHIVRTDGRAAVSRTKMFAEALVSIEGNRYLLSVPIDGALSLPECVREAAHIVRHLNSGAFPEYRILPQELVFTDSAGRESCCDVIIESHCEGIPLGNAVHYADTASLLAALDMLRDTFLEAGVVHRNLLPSNLVWGNDRRLYPVRFHYLRRASSREDIMKEFAAVKEFILSFPTIPSAATEPCKPYETALQRCYDEVSPLHDMMRRVRRGNLYGYVDDRGESVIEPRFIKAGNFCENRAAVATAEGMGIIDRTGRYILEPKYDIADYDPDRCGYVARRDSVWYMFDYMGRLSHSGTYEELFSQTDIGKHIKQIVKN